MPESESSSKLSLKHKLPCSSIATINTLPTFHYFVGLRTLLEASYHDVEGALVSGKGGGCLDPPTDMS